MANPGQIDNVLRMVFGHIDVLAFPKALQDDLIKVLSKTDDLDRMADDIVEWRRAVFEEGRPVLDDAGEALEVTAEMRRFFTEGATVARLHSIPKVQQVAIEFETLYKSAAGDIDVDKILDGLRGKNSPLPDSDITTIRESFEAQLKTREQTVQNIMRDHGVDREAALEGLSRKMHAEDGDVVPPKVEPETPAPKAEEPTTPKPDEENAGNPLADTDDPVGNMHNIDDADAAKTADDADAAKTADDADAAKTADETDEAARNAGEDARQTPGADEVGPKDRGLGRKIWDSTLGFYINNVSDYLKSFPYFDRIGGFDLHKWQRHFTQPFHNQWDAFRNDNTVSFILNLDSSIAKSANYVSEGRQSAAETLNGLKGLFDSATGADDLAKAITPEALEAAVAESRKALNALNENMAAIEKTGSAAAKRAANEGGEFIESYRTLVTDLETKVASGQPLSVEELDNLRTTTTKLYDDLVGTEETQGLARKIAGSNTRATSLDAPIADLISRQIDWNAIRDFDIGLVEIDITKANGFSRSEVRAAQKAERHVLLQGAADGKHVQQRNIEAAWALSKGIEYMKRRDEVRILIQKGVFEMIRDGRKDDLVTSLKRLMFTYADNVGETGGSIQTRGNGIPSEMGLWLKRGFNGTESPAFKAEVEEMGRLIEHMSEAQAQIPVRRRAALLEEYKMNYYREYRLDRQSDASVIGDARRNLRQAKKEFRAADAVKDSDRSRFDRARDALTEAKEDYAQAKSAGYFTYFLKQRMLEGKFKRSFEMMARYPKMIGVPRATMQTLKLVIIPAAIVKGGTMAYDFLTGNTPVADSIEEAKEISNDLIDDATASIEGVNDQFKKYEDEINEYEKEANEQLDELIAGETDATKKAQYAALKTQVATTVTAFRTQIAHDKSVFQSAAQKTLDGIKQSGAGLDSAETLEQAQQINAIQQAQFNAMSTAMLALDEKRGDELALAFDSLDDAIKEGKPLATVPGLSALDTIIQTDQTIDPANVDIAQVKAASTANLTEIQKLPGEITKSQDGIIGQIDTFVTEQTATLDEKIKTLTDAGNAAEAEKYTQIKAQMLQTMTAFKTSIGEDKTSLLANAQGVITQVGQFNTQIQNATDPATADQLLAQQNNAIAAGIASTQNTMQQRAQQIHSATQNILNAIAAGTPLTTLPAPGVIAPNQPNANNNGGAGNNNNNGGNVAPPPVVDNRPQWQKDLDAQKTEAAQYLSRANSAAALIGRYASNPNGEAPGAAELLVAINKQEQAIIDLQNEFRQDGNIQSANDLDYFLKNVRLNEADAQQMQIRLNDIQNDITRLVQDANTYKKAVDDVTSFGNKGDATSNLRQLRATTDQLEAKRTEAEQILTSITGKARENAELMNKNQDIKYRYGTAYQIDEGLKKIGGGEQGLPYQIFGKGESGISSVAGGYLQTAWNSVKGVGEWWGDVKRNARTQTERNWYNGIEAGLGIFGSLAAFNFINDNLFGGKVQGVAKWGIMLAVAGYFLHRTGAVGNSMAASASGRSPFVSQSNSNYGATSRTTGNGGATTTNRTHTPTTGGGNSTGGSDPQNAANANGAAANTVIAPIVDRNGQKVDHIVYVDGKITVQNMTGGLPRTADDIVVDPAAAAQINAGIQQDLDRIKTENGINPAMGGTGAHLPNPLKGEVDVVINSDGAPQQVVTVEYTVSDPETADLTRPR